MCSRFGSTVIAGNAFVPRPPETDRRGPSEARFRCPLTVVKGCYVRRFRDVSTRNMENGIRYTTTVLVVVFYPVLDVATMRQGAALSSTQRGRLRGIAFTCYLGCVSTR